ncbi:hypothetical protein MferCBS31731_004773 [Microsporum ferrugineum]
MSYSLLLAYVYFLISTARPVRSACDPVPPLSLPIGNATITDRDVVRWGLGVQFGTPPQTIVAALDADWNSTSFWNTSFPCGNLTRPACSWVHGGSFNDASSTSWRAPSDPDLTDSSPGNETIRIRGTDTLNLGSDISIDQFPIYFPKPRVIPQNSLGLGPNSTFLNLLFDQGKIASKTWSLFWGWQGAEKENQMNGSLVLGGYDKAKMGGANLTAKFSDGVGCPSSLLVYLSNIAVNHADGNKTSLFSTAGSALRACIKADNPQVTLPEDVFENLKKAFPGKTVEHSTGIYPNSLAYEPENIFAGNITFTLSSGLQITIPNHQIVLPNVAIDDNGEQEIVDNNKTVNFAQTRQGVMSYLGQPFLTAAYLHVDNELKEFTVWQVNPTTDTELVPVQHDSDECGNDDDSSSLSGGAIAGIVVGVVAFLALAALGLFFFLRRRNQSKDRDSKAGLPLVNTSHGVEDKKHYNPQEMDAGVGQQAPAELPDRDYPPQELPADVPSSNK